MIVYRRHYSGTYGLCGVVCVMFAMKNSTKSHRPKIPGQMNWPECWERRFGAQISSLSCEEEEEQKGESREEEGGGRGKGERGEREREE